MALRAGPVGLLREAGVEPVWAGRGLAAELGPTLEPAGGPLQLAVAGSRGSTMASSGIQQPT